MTTPKNCFNRISVIGIFVLVLLTAFSSASADNTIERAREGVVCIYVENLEGESLGYGSGFVVGTEEPFKHVATAWHIIAPEAYGLPDNHTLNVYIWTSRDDRIPAQVQVSLPETGIALLELSANDQLYGYEAMQLGDGRTVSSGDDLYALGFPSGDVDELGTAYVEDTVVKSGSLSRHDDLEGVEFLHVDADIDQGNSGGPILNQAGQVVGINDYNIKREEGIDGAVLINYLIEVLDRRGIEYLSGAPVDHKDDTGLISGVSDDVLLYGGIGAAILVILIAVLMVTSSQKKKRRPSSSQRNVQRRPPGSPGERPMQQTPAPPGTPPTPGAPQQQASPAGNMHQAQGQVQAQSQPSGQAQQPPGSGQAVSDPPGGAPKTVAKGSSAGTQAVLIGVSGYFAGNKLELGQGRMSIGRDPRLSQLVYPQDNEEISRKHCTIFYEDKIGQFGLEDSSSNGTFLSSNERLETGKTYYLKPGDRFFITDPKETFEVKVE